MSNNSDSITNDAWALRWRDSVVDAVLNKSSDVLHKLSISALKQQPSAQSLAVSGAGLLLADPAIWIIAGPETEKNATAALARWKRGAGSTKRIATAVPAHPLGPKKTKGCLLALDHFELWLAKFEGNFGSAVTCKEVAKLFALRGFENWRQMRGLDNGDVQDLTQKPAAKALVVRALTFANSSEADCSRSQSSSSSGVAPGASSALEVMNFIDPVVSLEREQLLEKNLSERGRAGLGISLKPSAAIDALSSAGTLAPVDDVLDNMILEKKLDTNKKSTASIPSGLKAWHGFASRVLNYDESKTLPPRSSKDIQRYAMIFKNAGTVCNYNSYILWACRTLELDTSWRDNDVTMVLKGLSKAQLRLSGGLLKARLLLDDGLVRAPVVLLDALEACLLSCAITVWWELLLRVRSEGLIVFVGEPSWAVQLPPDIFAAIWIHNDVMYLRLRSRKHRPSESLLFRKCSCSRVHGRQFCAFHRAKAMIGERKVGSLL